MTDVAPPGGEHKLGVEGTITGSEAVFHLTGELDLAGVARLERATAVAHDQGARTVVLDVSRLDFVDSTGLHQLVRSLQRQREVGGDLILHRPSARTLRVLDIAGLSNVLTITN